MALGKLIAAIPLTLLCMFVGASDEGSDPFAAFTPGQVDLPEGGRIAYYVRERSGPCLVLIPGSWGDYRVFNHVVPALDPGIRIVIVELRGHGESQPPTLNGSIELFAEDVLHVIDRLGLKRFYVGGHSIGGMIAIEVAGRRPHMVAGAIPIEGWTHHEVARDAFGGRITPTLSPEQDAEREANQNRVRSRMTEEQIKSFGAIWRTWNGQPILQSTDVPFLHIWGDRGMPAPSRDAMRIPDRPNMTIHWEKGASHSLLIERPREVAEAINRFIAETEHASSSQRSLDTDGDYRITAAKGPYFLCDDRVVEDRWLVERFVVQPKRHGANPLLVRDRPWEGTGPHAGGSVLFDERDHLYRMWYSVWNRDAYYNKLPFSYNVCYAESEDGLAWRKPDLGIFEFQGSTANNIIRLGVDKTQNIDVCFNPQPDTYPGRFLAIHNQKGGVFVSTSDDGKSFSFLDAPPAIPYHSDTHNNLVFDEIRERWLLFCRPRAYAGYHKRRVSLIETRDLHHWGHERTILVPGEVGAQEFYGMTVFRRGDLFFGALQTYDRVTGFVQAELAWSGDGARWSRVETQPAFVERGVEGAWDGGMVFLMESPVVRGDEMRFYYGGFPLPHDTNEENIAGVGLLLAERDRLIGVRPSGNEPGTLMTRPVSPNGRRLFVNARVAGAIRVELRSDDNKVLEGWGLDACDPVTSSAFAQEITWGGRSLRDAPQEELRLIFQLHNAELFTFDLMDESI